MANEFEAQRILGLYQELMAARLFLAQDVYMNDLVKTNPVIECDVVMIGAGVMSATLAAILKELDPKLSIQVFEKLGQIASESSAVFNNAGTGHSALCELNYSPQKPDGSISLDKAIHILEMFEITKQFLTYMVQHGHLPAPDRFIHSVPHVSFVWGEKNINYLRARNEAMKSCHLFQDTEYSEDAQKIKNWLPLMMKGVNLQRPIAVSRNVLGTDLNFETITKELFNKLEKDQVFVSLRHEVRKIRRDAAGFWNIEVKDHSTSTYKKFKTKFVFIGAGGNALPLLEASRVKEVSGYGGFPVGGQWLICKNKEVIEKHEAKVYGLAPVGSPPMSVPHLDTRIVDGEKALLFGPFATFSFKFLKSGSQWDLVKSVIKSPRFSNAIPLMSVGIHNFDLTRYLISQLRLTFVDKVNQLREFVPDAKIEDWESHNAGQRVQVIKRPTAEAKKTMKHAHAGILEFGTEVVCSHDGSLAAVLGASPGASCVVSIMLEILGKCFSKEMATEAWQDKIKEMIPTHGQKLYGNPELTRKTRERTHGVLNLKLPG